jgi:3-phosphoshikimate 1-carboxyvinyltransferase
MNDPWHVQPAGALRGEIGVNGDKSVSHRALMIGGVCDGPVRVTGFGPSADTLATRDAMRSLGVRIDDLSGGELVVHGVGLRGLRAPAEPIDARNAGTLMRLLPGLLAGQVEGTFVLDGDASLRRRPMRRVAEPLARMGAAITTTAECAPLTVVAGSPLAGIDYQPPVASAQVKSCLLLAGLSADGVTRVIEPIPSRDHTERLLKAAGARIERFPGRVEVQRTERLALERIEVPGDLSSAAFLIAAATLLPESHIFLRGIGVNPGRTGMLTVLERMGARVSVFDRRVTEAGEPIANIEVRAAELIATEIEPELVPSLIDELPLLALLACCARGRTVVRGAEDLKAKESDRIAAVQEALTACGARIDATPDGWRIRGVPARLRGGTVDPHGDHRIAMMGAIAGLHSEQGVRITDPACIAVSFPGFREILGAAVAVRERD